MVLAICFSATAGPALADAPPVSEGQEQTAEPNLAPAIRNLPDAGRFAIFTPTDDPIRHRIDYEIWDFALKNLVVNMGPSTRQTARPAPDAIGTRIRQGHNSRYRLEGSMLGFGFLDERAITSFTEYRRELESLADTLDIASLPRNEQLAFWLNLHNVAMVEQIAKAWPVRQPRQIEIDGVALNDAPFLKVRGIPMSLRDIRENIVFANWKSPKVMYGFWRGEIGGPALEREAFTGANVNILLSLMAEDFVNSLRGTQKRGDALDVSTLYEEASAYYFPDFANDVREHILEFADDEVLEILADTTQTKATIREWDIADLNAGRRDSIALVNSRPGLSAGAAQLLAQREQKLQQMRRDKERTGRVYFTEITLPGDPPNKGQVD